MSVELIKQMSNPAHKQYNLLLKRVYQVRERKTRTNVLKYYNLKRKSEHFKNSDIKMGF